MTITLGIFNLFSDVFRFRVAHIPSFQYTSLLPPIIITKSFSVRSFCELVSRATLARGAPGFMNPVGSFVFAGDFVYFFGDFYTMTVP